MFEEFERIIEEFEKATNEFIEGRKNKWKTY